MPKLIDLSGLRFGELVVQHLSSDKIKERPAWVCLCDCGKTRTVSGEWLRNGDATSCGTHKTKAFFAAVIGSQHNRIHPKGTDTHSRIYTLWRAMLWRCTDPSHVAYHRYGGAGISVCEEWQTFGGFRAWAVSSGYRDDLTIDRIDNTAGYRPDNCRWATRREQARNRATTRFVTAWGETRPLMDWPDDPRCLVSAKVLGRRLDFGHPPEMAMRSSESELRHLAAVNREATKRARRQAPLR